MLDVHLVSSSNLQGCMLTPYVSCCAVQVHSSDICPMVYHNAHYGVYHIEDFGHVCNKGQ